MGVDARAEIGREVSWCLEFKGLAHLCSELSVHSALIPSNLVNQVPEVATTQ